MHAPASRSVGRSTTTPTPPAARLARSAPHAPARLHAILRPAPVFPPHTGAQRTIATLLRPLVAVSNERPEERDRKSTRLNSSHASISYAVFCLKKHTTAPGRTSPRRAGPRPL